MTHLIFGLSFKTQYYIINKFQVKNLKAINI